MEWKRVKDELPPLDKKVLLLEKDGVIAIGYRFNCYRFDINDYDFPLDQVYAWTYLPKPCTIKYDENTKVLSAEQFLGCICDILIELDDPLVHLKELGKCSNNNALDEVFAKLYHDNIVADFFIEFTFDTIFKDMFKDMCEDVFILKRKYFPCVHYEIEINKNNYKEKYRDILMKDLEHEIEEKIKTYLKDYYFDKIKGEWL